VPGAVEVTFTGQSGPECDLLPPQAADGQSVAPDTSKPGNQADARNADTGDEHPSNAGRWALLGVLLLAGALLAMVARARRDNGFTSIDDDAVVSSEDDIDASETAKPLPPSIPTPDLEPEPEPESDPEAEREPELGAGPEPASPPAQAPTAEDEDEARARALREGLRGMQQGNRPEPPAAPPTDDE
jgi:hypothetical protein